jgi:carbamoyl-phosphate synthase large subunit
MPRRTDLKRILVIGSGPIVIGQSSEFDYSGTQACKALKDEGLEVVLINSNPATIMTDPEFADRTYVEPLTTGFAEAIIAVERPDAVLPTVGGQTALNLAVALHEEGILAKYGVELIGAQIDAIKVGEDRLLFRDAMQEIGLDVPASGLARTPEEALDIVHRTGFPAIIRPSFTLGGVGGGIAYNVEEFRDLVARGLSLSPVHEVLIEESVIGWKEYELEVMRDVADNFVVICSIENVDPMGVHTGDSITVAPALTLSDKEYQRMRDAARRIIRRVGVETGGSNIQFAVNPVNGRMIVIEMNPRVSRSSALASKATGFPIAKIAAKLALGYHLDEIPNDITRLTPASFEPTIDYIVVKIPRWNFEKFPEADRTLTTQMKSVGEAMAIGRTFKEAFLKGIRSLELGSRAGRLFSPPASDQEDAEPDAALRTQLVVPSDRRMWAIFEALGRGWTVEMLHECTRIDPWFLQQFADIAELEKTARMLGLRQMSPELLLTLKRAGFGDLELAGILGVDETAVRQRRLDEGFVPAYKRIDTCAAEFESFTPYMYGSYEPFCESDPNPKKKVVILGSGPNRIGQGIEFDYCCCHAAFALREELLLPRRLCPPRGGLRDGDDQLQPGDRLDGLRHDGSLVLRAAHVRGRDGGARQGALGGGQRGLPGAVRRADTTEAGTAASGRRCFDSRHLARFDRSRRGSPPFLAAAVGSRDPAAGERDGDVTQRGTRCGRQYRLSRRRAPVVRARRPRHGDRVRHGHAGPLHGRGGGRVARTAGADRQVPRGRIRV